MKKQYEGYINKIDLKPIVKDKQIFFVVNIDYEDLDKYHGDARSFGFNFDYGKCTIVTYERAVGVLADDTAALLEECRLIKKHLKKPKINLLEIDETNNTDCIEKNSELLINYNDDFFYKDSNGYWLKKRYCSDDDYKSYRITNESAEIYMQVNKEYKRQIKKRNELMKEARSNFEILEKTIKK